MDMYILAKMWKLARIIRALGPVSIHLDPEIGTS